MHKIFVTIKLYNYFLECDSNCYECSDKQQIVSVAIISRKEIVW